MKAPAMAKKISFRSMVIVLVVGLILGVGLTLWVTKPFSATAAFDHQPKSRTSEVVNAVTREQQVVLLSLGIQGISQKSDSSTFFGVHVPGSSRATFLMYSFDAKLGIDGKQVKVEEIGQDEYEVKIPEFIFIGHSNEEFTLAAENNGALSWVTPEIDPVELINGVLSDDTEAQYIASNEEILRSQTQAFYSSIVTAIDPDLTLHFDFAGDQG